MEQQAAARGESEKAEQKYLYDYMYETNMT